MADLDLDTSDCAVTSTDRLRRLMRIRYAAPAWALFEEVPQTTGFGASGYADAVAMSLYPSKGLTVHGFELKVSRSDWLHELKNEGKAETIFRFCDFWWLVVGDRGIVKPGELPGPWGLIAPRGDGLAEVVKAPKLSPVALDRGFVAALARRANEIAEASVQARIDEATKDLGDRLTKAQNERDEARSQVNTRLHAQVAEFEKASGISLRDGWRGPKAVGAAVKMLLTNNPKQIAQDATYARNTLAGMLKRLDELLETFPPEKDTEDGL